MKDKAYNTVVTFRNLMEHPPNKSLTSERYIQMGTNMKANLNT